MMDCKKVEEKIVAGEPLDVDAELHLLQCKNCQAFSEVHNLAVGLPEISEETDSAVMAKCRASLRRPAFLSFRRIAAVAACLVIVLALSAIHWKRSKPNREFALSAEEQLMLEYSLGNDYMSEMELLLSDMELPLIASNNTTTNSNVSATDLHYEILSLEMDLNF